jgi:parallel beta-helix repeat protein
LTQDIIDQNVSACINIIASGITIDCQNHLIDGVDFYVPPPDEQMSFGIVSNGYSNIAIRNCRLSDWSHPLSLLNGENISVENIEAFSGVWIGAFVSDSNNVYLSNITVHDFAQDSFTFRNTINSRLENAVIYNGGHHGIAIDGNSNNISLENIEVFNTSDIGINVNGNNHVLRNLTVHSTQGIWVWGNNHMLEDIETFDTTAERAGVGIHSDNTVLRNIYNHDEYHSVLGGVNNTLEYSRCENVTWGCWHIFGNNITVRHNNFPSGMSLFGSSYGEIYNNTIGDGISMQDWNGVSSSYNEIYNNYIYKETPCGISLINSNDNLIYNNIINSSQAVCFGGDIYTNYWNTTLQTGNNIWNTSLGYIGGNAWFKPDSTGYSETSSCHDTNADGFCDNPYVLATNNIDYLPIAKTVGQYPVYLSITFSYSSIDFGTLQHNTINPAPNQAQGVYNVSVDTNSNYVVKAYGNDFTPYLSISNLKFDTNSSVENLDINQAISLSTSPQTIDTYPPTVTINYHGYWLNIPYGQYATTYTTTVTINYEIA